MWQEHFPGSPEVSSEAPGRVNLIGEHTDYNEGYVFPAAIDRGTRGLFRRSDGPTRVLSRQAGWSTAFDPGKYVKSKNWARFVSACALRLRDVTGEQAPSIEGVIDSDIPSGSGLSSSAALELCLLSAMNVFGGYGLSNFELAIIAAEADNVYVGVQSGVMDQMASALGEKDCALFIDTRSREYSAHRLPSGISIAILDTRKPRTLASSAYNERVAECRRAVEAISAVDPSIRSLRDATEDHLKQAHLDEVAMKRARHVLSENSRTIAFRDSLLAGDLKAIGTLAKESHESLRDDYEVSCQELDAMARAAWGAPGCIAARMTGAGFGGCCVALFESQASREFEASVWASYGMYGFRVPVLFETSAARGARATQLGN